MSLMVKHYACEDDEPLTLLEAAVQAGQPLLSWEDANKKVVELTCEVIRLTAEVDRLKFWDEV
jgi:hypothetical protein